MAYQQPFAEAAANGCKVRNPSHAPTTFPHRNKGVNPKCR